MVRSGILIIVFFIFTVQVRGTEIFLKNGEFVRVTDPKVLEDGSIEAGVNGWCKVFPRSEIKRIDSGKPPEFIEADALIRARQYEPGYIYFNQYALRRRGLNWEAYCVERAAYCLVQLNRDAAAIKSLEEFRRRAGESFNYRDRVDHDRAMQLLGRLYCEDDRFKQALEVLEGCTHFDSSAAESLHLLRVSELQWAVRGITLEDYRETIRKYMMAVLFFPPGTPGRLTMLEEIIHSDCDISVPLFENIANRDYPYRNKSKRTGAEK